MSNTVEMMRKESERSGIESDLASWNTYLQKSSVTRDRSDSKRPMLLPPTSNATFKMLSAINRIESVCLCSCGLSSEIKTRKSSRMAGRP